MERGRQYEIVELRKLIKECKLSCTECGKLYDETKRQGGIEVHHKNKDTKDNVLTNLEVLCAVCHQTRHPREALSDEVKRKISESQKARHRKKDCNE